jgi:hypothetical protein
VEIVGIGGPVRVCATGYSILRYDHGDRSSSCFSIAHVEEPWSECDEAPLATTTAEALAERMRTHGGFLVPAASIKTD